MADPFSVLRAPVTPADPDPAFAARLRARLERALDLPEGVAVSDTGAIMQPHPAPVAATRRRGAPAETDDSPRAGPGPPGRAISGTHRCGCRTSSRARRSTPPCSAGSTSPRITRSARQVPAATPPQGLWGGQPRATLFCSYVVDDATAAVARVRAAGGQAGDPVQRPYGLVADCTDDQGTRFAVHQYPAAGPPGAGAAGTAGAAAAGPAAAPRDGDLAYVTFEVVDSRRARDFYGAVLGWRFAPGRIADGWQVEGTTPHGRPVRRARRGHHGADVAGRRPAGGGGPGAGGGRHGDRAAAGAVRPHGRLRRRARAPGSTSGSSLAG